MLFKFIDKPITIHALLDEDFEHLIDVCQIKPSSRFIPKWWKDTPNSGFNFDTFERHNTVKGCLGIIGTFTTGYIQPLWSDLAILYDDNDGKYQFSDYKSKAVIHGNNQIPNFHSDSYFLKLYSPWIFLSSKEIKYCHLDPFYLQQTVKPYIIPYGITDTVNKIFNPNIFLMLRKNGRRNEIMIDYDTPMTQTIPITDRPIIFKVDLISKKHKDKLNRIPTTFKNIGIKWRKLLGNEN